MHAWADEAERLLTMRETHRLTVTPSALGEFMYLLLRLDFSENMGVPGS